MGKQTLKDLTHELGHDVSAMLPTVKSLVDVEIVLAQLTDDMDGVIYRGEECAGYYREHHRMINVLWRLIRYTVHDLAEEYEKIERSNEKIFNMIVREENEKSPIAGNDETFQ